MGVIAQFNYAAWIATYPEFQGVSKDLADQYWGIAELLFANDGSGPIAKLSQQEGLMNLLVSHIAWLAGKGKGNQGRNAGVVGRISQASEGSVSVQVEGPKIAGGTADYFTQTGYGLLFWQATAPYRTFVYRPPTGRQINPYAS